ncbi:multifunctional oxoglutarate decarboxylase/oxoglutarate dehydrogenase thiamine pyrophosphate-binding subunit/dihydrolipoyllysine-residue succinyltransferase subunit [Actinopolymorpha alba]|uniref:multifunctional oxoglutarate decarboxylase/oxoglutarate dehydrogenase thiamine pyrophosphate-binding subunit/dihydrolipoyllysine-residue succinyltransferase subunit n=1 Tax=Actinopolymorpha alba TaxID=533267 RepID=UPI0003733425|nr:multifunctional oxoglutarate decarboxylase/oxoglutarate dehydrogenase thiamine pyrophosphate-binding subunit/dihydrolipoyllysine-residue succinyltransferase subunit [Actinopolymorpha alba]
MASQSSHNDPLSQFGTNEWLVDEMYQRYLKDPNSVDKAWLAFFRDYQPESNGRGRGGEAVVTSAPSSPAAAPSSSPPQPSESAAPSAQRAAVSTPSRPAPAAPAKPTPTPAPAKPAPSTPAAPAKPAPAKPAPSATPAATVAPAQAELVPLRGAAARTAKNMDESLTVPTATSVRQLPVKLLIDNRIVINNHLARSRGGKVSFTHIIGYAIAKAARSMPEMTYAYTEVDGKPTLVKPPHLALGLAIDIQKSDGTRQLLVPNIKNAETLDFASFWGAYEDVVRRARTNKLTVADFQGTTISLTNVGTVGTTHPVPRLMSGQSAIIGVGAMQYPAEYQGAAEETMNRLAVSKVMTITSTYDHRVIQGAQSGEFLRRVHQLLLGDEDFYDDIFAALRIPYEPVRWVSDIPASHDDEIGKQARVLELIHAYRVRGHLIADTDPLDYKVRRHADLDVVTHGLTLWDLDREFATGSFGGGKRFMMLRHILGLLRDAYSRTIGIEYMHIQEPEERRWIQDRVERPQDRLPREEQLRILAKLNQAEAFETFLQTKYVGQRRFSLEGGESAIALLDEICEQAAMADLDEVTIGMAHRGRLNVLANIAGKSPAHIFREFEGNIDPRTIQGSGDVKYHLGAEGEFSAESGARIKVSVAANPSHLEAVDPVLEGIARAKQDILNLGLEYPVLPVLVHGDAAFAGQGVVAETLNLSQLRGYRTGGTIHVIVNNQVGFTTSPTASRSSTYCTDVARMVQAPIFHVNGDDPEACIRVARLAFEYRQQFHKDVVIDVICYRRRGHNETDDPSFTQPRMYDLIEQKRSVRKLYTEALIGRGDISVEEAEQALRDYQERLERVFAEVRAAKTAPPEDYITVPEYPEKPAAELQTAVPFEVLKKIADAHVSAPEGFTVHPKVLPQLQRRAAAITEGPIDWGTAEIVAFGSLLMAGRPVRLAGQDSRRGTFVQRFATIIDRQTSEEWSPLQHLDDSQGPFYAYDSLLSEFAAMGFEYGYSVARPDALVCWEAQFGDFANGAQTIIDEFISSGEAKWGQNSGVVLLLPHGYEGQGPDHSSARIERFLQMGADGSMTIAQPSLPSNYFHLLRWHTLGAAHRPLIVFTPKSMLRNKAATSHPSEFTQGTFRPVIGDDTVDPSAVTRVLLSSGKIGWELFAERKRLEGDHPRTAIVRVEQLSPLPAEQIKAELAKYPNASDVRWVQDEPTNQGPWPHMALNLVPQLDGRQVRLVSRQASAAPAVGSGSVHRTEQSTLLGEAFA